MKPILLLGPLKNQIDPTQTGGAIVLFENLLEQCQIHKINYKAIDTNKKNYDNVLQAYISILFELFRLQKDVQHISLHSSRDYIVLGLFVAVIGKLFGKTTSLRKFGGEAANVYNHAGWVRKRILSFIYSNITVLFFEMKHLVEAFIPINPNTYWFPNVRRKTLIPNLPRKFSKKFVFISHVKPEKGVDEILRASAVLDESYAIDIYGPISDPKYAADYLNSYKATYKKAIPSTEVLKTLNDYDVVLLPSYKEGYPGIIIEAYSLGIPVIATTLQGISEITDPYQTGILIEPKDIDGLVSAIRYFNESNYELMSQNAYAKFDAFDSDIQTMKFFKSIGLNP